MANINELRFRLAIMLSNKRKQRPAPKWELYARERMSGMKCVEIAKKYGVSHQAVSNAWAKYRKRMDQEVKNGK